MKYSIKYTASNGSSTPCNTVSSTSITMPEYGRSTKMASDWSTAGYTVVTKEPLYSGGVTKVKNGFVVTMGCGDQYIAKDLGAVIKLIAVLLKKQYPTKRGK
jgi:hypothetical protein